MREQDNQLDQLVNLVDGIGVAGKNIGRTVDQQNRMLDKLDGNVETNINVIRRT